MKHLLISIFATLACCNIVAEDVTYWTGFSNNQDPVMRHHEAFMSAFVMYAQTSRHEVEVNAAGGYAAKSASSHGNTCQMEIVSSATHDGCDTVTIAIGRGSLINYACQEEIELLPDGGAGQVEIFRSTLLIRYKGESGGMEMASEHLYNHECYLLNGNIKKTNFKYECLYIDECHEQIQP